MDKVFVSYSRADSEFVDKLVDDLHRNGVDVWTDRDNIEGGAAWRAAISQAIRDCRAFLVVLSTNSVASKNVSRELAIAELRNRLIVPLMYQACDIPANMEYQLAELQWIDFVAASHEVAFKRLVNVLVKRDASSPAKRPDAEINTPVGAVPGADDVPKPGESEENAKMGRGVEVQPNAKRKKRTPPPSVRLRPARMSVSVRRLAQIDPATWLSETFLLSDDSRRIAYVNKVGGFLGIGVKVAVVVDGRMERYYSEIGGLCFSLDGERVAYWARDRDNRVIVVVDGQEGKDYNNVSAYGPLFSADGRRFAYAATLNNQWTVVVNGKEGRTYAGIGEGDPVFSPDSRRVAYTAKVDDEWTVVVDGEEGSRYAGITKGTPVFSPDSRHVAYGAIVGDKSTVVVDGEEGSRYAGITKGTPVFSPDSRHVAYGAKADEQWVIVVDGCESPCYEGISSAIKFDTGDRLHWVYVKKNEFFLAMATVE